MPRPRIHANAAAKQRAYRERRKRERAGLPPARPPLGADAAAVVAWAAASLRVPHGHPLAGQPFKLEPWQVAVIDDALTHRETLLCIARKNAKSATIAVLVLAFLAGPLRRPGWRAGVLSASRGKAGELLRQLEAIRDASGLQGLTVRRTPWPGRMVADDTGATVEIEGATNASGHAAGYDLAIIDELGLLQERQRPAVNGMRSAGGAKDGRFLALTIHGDGPFVDEILNRKGAPGLAIHHYHGDPDLPIDDPRNWRLANPALGVIKAVTYMRDEAARVIATPSDQAAFRAHDLNLPGAPVGELIASVESWRRCEVAPPDLPRRSGPCFVGVDLGLNRSFCSAAAWWPETSRLEVLTAAPDTPGLAARAPHDAAGALYERAHRDGVLMVLSGRLTPVGAFLARLKGHLAGQRIAAVGCDRVRHNELTGNLADLGLPWRPVWRGSGARATEDAYNDIAAFQRAVEGETLRTLPNILMANAIGESHIVRDAQGRAKELRQARRRARIDSLQAAVIALGLGAGAGKRRRLKVHVA